MIRRICISEIYKLSNLADTLVINLKEIRFCYIVRIRVCESLLYKARGTDLLSPRGRNVHQSLPSDCFLSLSSRHIASKKINGYSLLLIKCLNPLRHDWRTPSFEHLESYIESASIHLDILLEISNSKIRKTNFLEIFNFDIIYQSPSIIIIQMSR